MATEQAQEHADWRANQKERERERRRMRDRQRRQSMSLEEREKHLARRRKNYQLRRQKAANAQLGFEQANANNVTGVESEILNDNLEIVCVSELNVQSSCDVQDPFSAEDDKEDASDMKYDVCETTPDEPYKYPRIPHLNQIRQLARRLNAASVDNKSSVDTSQGIGEDVDVVNAELDNPNRVRGRRIRLIHVKHLARALNSNGGKVSEQKNHSYRIQGKNDQMTSEGAYSNGHSNDD